nr:MAG TPA: hypothetical protein [Caudoviricetes sp.]
MNQKIIESFETIKQQIVDAIVKMYGVKNERGDKYFRFGIRTDSREFAVGDEMPCSLRWDDCCPTEEELDGTCATNIYWDDWTAIEDEIDDIAEGVERALKIQLEHYGNPKYIIAGEDFDYGEDNDEVIIKNAVVIEIIK